MRYSKPQLLGFSAITMIQETDPGAKTSDQSEIHPDLPTDPAYQADE